MHLETINCQCCIQGLMARGQGLEAQGQGLEVQGQ